MSAESQEIFYDALHGDASPEELRAAAVGHLGASRSLEELTAEYARALDAGDHETAQRLAEELAPVRTAMRVADGAAPEATEG